MCCGMAPLLLLTPCGRGDVTFAFLFRRTWLGAQPTSSDDAASPWRYEIEDLDVELIDGELLSFGKSFRGLSGSAGGSFVEVVLLVRVEGVFPGVAEERTWMNDSLGNAPIAAGDDKEVRGSARKLCMPSVASTDAVGMNGG